MEEHPDLEEKLLNTAPYRLIEASVDPKWGAGAPFNSRKYDDGTFTGKYCDTLDDVDVLWRIVLSRIEEILTVMCPYKRVCLRDPKTPWITPEIIKAFNDRRKYLRMFPKTKNKHIWEICKYLRNKCNLAVQRAKSEFIKKF